MNFFIRMGDLYIFIVKCFKLLGFIKEVELGWFLLFLVVLGIFSGWCFGWGNFGVVVCGWLVEKLLFFLMVVFLKDRKLNLLCYFFYKGVDWNVGFLIFGVCLFDFIVFFFCYKKLI